ncbi:MAG: hypothetical protein GY854_28680 [Deltaproteobacteria bacterium]|nr:hypothetical protein [Deltaproteobacteria bacterium]
MAKRNDLKKLSRYVNGRSLSVYRRAFDYSQKQIEECKTAVSEYLRHEGLNPAEICVVIVGSVGRYEALSASDIDLIPVGKTQNALTEEMDAGLRRTVGEALRDKKVSAGKQLTRFVAVDQLTAPESIGGHSDSPEALTQRMLILSEGAQAGGDFALDEIRSRILAVYADEERTSGRNLLSLCNDLARYYRRLCIDYKAKIDLEDKDWCTRNIKLRHSRKFWYFSTILAVAAGARRPGREEDAFRRSLLKDFAKPPCLRLLHAVPKHLRAASGRLLESFAWFLDFMSRSENRAALAAVPYQDRYDVSTSNPFPALKYNSELLHREMLGLLEALDRPLRHRVLDWFLL